MDSVQLACLLILIAIVLAVIAVFLFDQPQDARSDKTRPTHLSFAADHAAGPRIGSSGSRGYESFFSGAPGLHAV